MENGYLYVYLSNASLKPVNFDNLHLQTIEGAMLEENHYYPYGMLIESLSARSAGKKTNLKYQSREWITELELNQYDFDLRQYDPATARWSATDPYMQFSNPYIAMANNPVLLTDPDGGKVDGSRLKAPIPEIPRDSKGRMIDDEHGGGGYSKWGNPRYSGGYIDELGHPLPDSYVMAMVGQGNIEWTSEIGNSCGFDELGAMSDKMVEFKAAGFETRFNAANGNFMASKDVVAGYNYEIYHSDHLTTEGKAFGVFATERTERQSFEVMKWDAQSGGGWDNSKLALDIGGRIFGALQTTVRPGDQWLGKNGKYYNNSWGGNQYTGGRSGAFKAANTYKWAGRATVGVSALIGVAETYNGYQMDGGQFGYNAQSAAFGTTGSLIGGWAGAEAGAAAGAAIGVWFGGVGAIPGAIIGGFIGGFGGGYIGGNIGSGAVNYYHGR